MTAKLEGVLTALVTPFAADGSVDVAMLRRVVDRSIDGGVHGVVACGSTGEFAALSNAERRLVVETVVDQAAGRVPVVAQTGAVSTAEAIELSKHAEGVGADALMLVQPYYEALTLTETERYLKTVSASVQVPIMLYNLPAVTGVNLEADFVGALARSVQNIKYIKDTSADMAHSARLIHHQGDVISTFVGWDTFVLSALVEGAAGVMAGTANAFAPQIVAVYNAVKAGDLAGAQAQWNRIYPVLDVIISNPFIAGVKSAMTAVGFPIGAPREPFLDVDRDVAQAIATLAKSI